MFVKGKSGNPSGRPKVPADVVELARALTPEAIETWAQIMRNKKAPAAARVQAAEKIVDRAYGKPAQHSTFEGSVATDAVDADARAVISRVLDHLTAQEEPDRPLSH